LGCLITALTKCEWGRTATGAFYGALIGGTLGYVVGRGLGRWETVEIDQVTVGDGALSFSLSIRP
jgi:outer membrane lipoprotein SlyB